MTLLAEEIVEEWLNRKGYFTIRGIKIGVHEIDILAIRSNKNSVVCKHVEVQASINPISYISQIPKSIQKATGKAPNSAKERSIEELELGVKEWIEKKYYMDKKKQLRERLHPGEWDLELVVHHVKHPEELHIIETNGIKVYKLASIIDDLASTKLLIEGASGTPLVDLVLLERILRDPEKSAGKPNVCSWTDDTCAEVTAIVHSIRERFKDYSADEIESLVNDAIRSVREKRA